MEDLLIMNFENSEIIPIKDDASFRKFYRKKTKKNSSIIVYAKKEKIKNLLIYDSINKLLIKRKILAPKILATLYAPIKFIDGIITISFFFNLMARKVKNNADVPLLQTAEYLQPK